MRTRARLTTMLVACGTTAVLGVGVYAALPASALPTARATCTITGTSGPDVLRGTTGDDVICGLGGDDTLLGGPGADVLYGGQGDDVLIGGSGMDLVVGGPGTDSQPLKDDPLDGPYTVVFNNKTGVRLAIKAAGGTQCTKPYTLDYIVLQPGSSKPIDLFSDIDPWVQTDCLTHRASARYTVTQIGGKDLGDLWWISNITHDIWEASCTGTVIACSLTSQGYPTMQIDGGLTP